MYENRFKKMKRYSNIGAFIANDLIKDGSTSQLDICPTPQQTILNLKHHKNLGINTEIFGESLLDAFVLGVISNTFKKEPCGGSVASFAIGNQETYELIDYNPALYIGETNYVNDISVFANNANVRVINSALEMDLSGQLADSVGLNIFSGVGGQVDFLGWSSLRDNGKPIICFFVVTYHVSVVFQQGAVLVIQSQYLWFECLFFFCF